MVRLLTSLSGQEHHTISDVQVIYMLNELIEACGIYKSSFNSSFSVDLQAIEIRKGTIFVCKIQATRLTERI